MAEVDLGVVVLRCDGTRIILRILTYIFDRQSISLKHSKS